MLQPPAEMRTREPTIVGKSISVLAPCSPIGFPSNTTCSNASFSSTPAQMVRQATLSILLLATFSVFNTLLSWRASPRAIPPMLPKALKDRSRYVKVVLTFSELHKSAAPSRRIMFHPNFRDLSTHPSLLNKSAKASPPVTRSGITVFKFSAVPIKFSDRSNSSRHLLVLRDVTKRSHSPSSTSARRITSLCNGQVPSARYALK
mmetsp:Transcript_43427/g.75493  ORF Transcript_43427/g.75493 Transcript_43427/m.75493 type:complete len:204 (+) Transcript_43427:667-1278(+)